MPLGTPQDTGKALIRPSDHRVTHDGHGKTAKAAEEALRAQNGLSAEAPLRPNPLSMHLGHAPRCGTVCPHTLASAVTHGARRQVPKGGPTYRLTSSRSHLTLAKDSGRTTAIEKESRMAVLFSTTRGVSWRRDFFWRFSHLQNVHSQQLSLAKVCSADANGDEERRAGGVWFPTWFE
jgi:hypothetical protein